MSEFERWHEKLGHVGAKHIRKCRINNLRTPKRPFRCEACIKGKMHRLSHTKNRNRQDPYQAGEAIHTDLQGPYVRSLRGEKYSQIFIDVASRKVWVVRLATKTESDDAIRKVLEDSKTKIPS